MSDLIALFTRSGNLGKQWARLERELVDALADEVRGSKRWARAERLLKEWQGWCNGEPGVGHDAWQRAADLVAAAPSFAEPSKKKPTSSARVGAQIRVYKRLLAAHLGQPDGHTPLRVPIGLAVGEDGIAAELVLDILEIPKSGGKGHIRPHPTVASRLLEKFQRSSEVAFAAACASSGTSRHSDVFYRVEWGSSHEQRDITGGSASLALWRALVWALDRRPIPDRPKFDSRVLVLGEIVEHEAGTYALESVKEIPEKVRAWAIRSTERRTLDDPEIDHVLVVDRTAAAQAKEGLARARDAKPDAWQAFEYIEVESLIL